MGRTPHKIAVGREARGGGGSKSRARERQGVRGTRPEGRRSPEPPDPHNRRGRPPLSDAQGAPQKPTGGKHHPRSKTKPRHHRPNNRLAGCFTPRRAAGTRRRRCDAGHTSEEEEREPEAGVSPVVMVVKVGATTQDEGPNPPGANDYKTRQKKFAVKTF